MTVRSNPFNSWYCRGDQYERWEMKYWHNVMEVNCLGSTIMAVTVIE